MARWVRFWRMVSFGARSRFKSAVGFFGTTVTASGDPSSFAMASNAALNGFRSPTWSLGSSSGTYFFLSSGSWGM